MKNPRLQKIEKTLSTRQPDLTVLLEDVHKPQNFSAILRSCDAVGIPMAHCVADKPAIRRFKNCAAGSNRWVGMQTHPNIASGIEHMHAQGMQVIAADLTDDAVDYREINYVQPTALLLGNELFGVSDEARALADGCVKIPMVGMIASLNVSVAAALLLYEALRQRQDSKAYEKRRISDEQFMQQRFEWMHPKLAAYCQKHQRPYPKLKPDGQIIGDLTGNLSNRAAQAQMNDDESALDQAQ